MEEKVGFFKRGAAAAPILRGGAVHGLLGGGGGVHGSHQAVGDTEIIVQDLGDGGQACLLYTSRCV